MKPSILGDIANLVHEQHQQRQQRQQQQQRPNTDAATNHRVTNIIDNVKPPITKGGLTKDICHFGHTSTTTKKWLTNPVPSFWSGVPSGTTLCHTCYQRGYRKVAQYTAAAKRTTRNARRINTTSAQYSKTCRRASQTNKKKLITAAASKDICVIDNVFLDEMASQARKVPRKGGGSEKAKEKSKKKHVKPPRGLHPQRPPRVLLM